MLNATDGLADRSKRVHCVSSILNVAVSWLEFSAVLAMMWDKTQAPTNPSPRDLDELRV
jgi:hypothetical protein